MSDEREEDLKELGVRFEHLFDKYYRYSVIYLRRMGFSEDVAQDLAQEAFIGVSRVIEELRGENEAAEKSYIKEASLHAGLNELRRRKRFKRAAKETSMTDLLVPDRFVFRDLFTGHAPATGEEQVGRKEMIQRLLGAIHELPRNLQDPLCLRIRGDTYNEIAAALGLTVNTVKSCLRNARRCLRDKLDEEPTGIDWPEDPAEDEP